MSNVLQRLYDFQPNDYVRASEFNAELDQIIALLAGTSTNKRGSTIFSDATLPVWQFNQTGFGDIVQFKKSNVTKVALNNSGQIVSSVATGTAPIKVASTTLVTNLNADKIDGVDSTALVRNDITAQFVTGNLRIKKASSGTYDIAIEQENNICTFYAYKIADDTISELFSITQMDQATRIVSFPANTKVQVQYSPSSANDVVRKSDFDARMDTLSVTMFMSSPNAGAYVPQAYICPSNTAGVIVKKLKIAYSRSTPTGTSIYELYKNGSPTGNTISITSGQAKNSVVSSTLGAPITLAENDFLQIRCNADNGHDDVTIAITGAQ